MAITDVWYTPVYGALSNTNWPVRTVYGALSNTNWPVRIVSHHRSSASPSQPLYFSSGRRGVREGRAER